MTTKINADANKTKDIEVTFSNGEKVRVTLGTNGWVSVSRDDRGVYMDLTMFGSSFSAFQQRLGQGNYTYIVSDTDGEIKPVSKANNIPLVKNVWYRG